MKKKLVPYLLFPIIVLIIMLLYGFSIRRNDNKKLEHLEIEFREGDNQFLTHNSVDNLLIQNGNPVKNQLKSSVNLYDLEREVLRNPYVEEATVYIAPDGLLKAFVKQREPVARLVTKNGGFYIDKYGKQIPLSEEFSSHVPLVEGVKSFSELGDVTNLVSFISADSFLKKEVVAIQKSKKDYVLIVRSGNYKINIGTVKNIDTKFKKLKAFYNKALKDKTLKKYKEINIKYHNQVVCTKQKSRWKTIK